ncbi:hypothetical protein AnigIFM49718_007866 [Aspergillus niger]|nr:hypothetical protein AnigIFM49718_007866 [Aspergillus niger]
MPANKLMKAEIPKAQIIKASSPSTLNPAFSLPSSKIPWLPDDVRVFFTAMALFVVLMLGLQWGMKVIAVDELSQPNCINYNHHDFGPLLRALHEHHGPVRLIFG